MTIDFMKLQTSQEALDPNPRSKKNEDLREYVLVERTKKTAEEKKGSDEKWFPRSEKNKTTEILDLGSIDDCEKDEANGMEGHRFRKSFNNGTFAAANFVDEGAHYLNLREVDNCDNLVMNGLPNMEPIPMLFEEPSFSASDRIVLQTSQWSLLTWRKGKVSRRTLDERGKLLLNKVHEEKLKMILGLYHIKLTIQTLELIILRLAIGKEKNCLAEIEK
ncbi:hypothetical protein SUGI_0405340 [Cryptomeria japonica]|nr:hypothetical protein SUGI_0405340 [Cryptomeria japonica]